MAREMSPRERLISEIAEIRRRETPDLDDYSDVIQVLTMIDDAVSALGCYLKSLPSDDIIGHSSPRYLGSDFGGHKENVHLAATQVACCVPILRDDHCVYIGYWGCTFLADQFWRWCSAILDFNRVLYDKVRLVNHRSDKAKYKASEEFVWNGAYRMLSGYFFGKFVCQHQEERQAFRDAAQAYCDCDDAVVWRDAVEITSQNVIPGPAQWRGGARG